jgi:hypothetical protein
MLNLPTLEAIGPAPFGDSYVLVQLPDSENLYRILVHKMNVVFADNRLPKFEEEEVPPPEWITGP